MSTQGLARRAWILFVVLLLPFASLAKPSATQAVLDEAFAPLLVERNCATFLDSKCQRKDAMLDMTLNACQISAKAHGCDQLVKDHPDLKDLVLDCTPKKFCEQHLLPTLAENKKCLNELYDGATDIFVVMGEQIDNTWKRVRTDVKYRLAYAKVCDRSLECKRNLAKNLPSYAKMTQAQIDKDLEKTPSLVLMSANDYQNFSWKSVFTGEYAEPRAPPARRGATELTAEQTWKWMDLWNMAGAEIDSKYNQYACYTPQALAELRCYIAGSLIDPGLALKAASKLTKADRLIKVLAKDSKSLVGSSFIRKNLYYSPTKPAQNVAWMQAAGSSQKGVRFFDVENSVMKSLNDTLKDKNLVTSLTNAHKKILQTKTDDLMKELKASYPELEMLSYSDFKASRFAFKGRGPPDLEERLAKILEETNSEFAQMVKNEKLIASTERPESWFRGGFGETADQATIASRYSRRLEDNTMQSFSSPEIQKTLTANLKNVESLRTQLRTELGNTSMIDSTLHQDAFDIIIKNSGNLSQAQSALKNRFGLSELPMPTVQKMKDYVTAVDGFSPGIHIGEREVANLDEAAFGGFSADMAGMGSMNQRGTAMALLESRGLEQALTNTRLAEKQVTEQFKIQQNKFKEIVTEVVGAKRIKTVCSGDDCVAIPLQTLSDSEKQQILEKLSASGYASKFRLSFIAKEIKNVEWRNQLSVHGEAIEKFLRKNLSDKMDPEKLKGVIFGVDMQTEVLGQGGVRLLTATHPNVRLTASELRLIEQQYERAVLQMGKRYYPAK